MTATKPHRGLRVLRLFLAFLGLVVLGLNTQAIIELEKVNSSLTPEQRTEVEIDSSFREDYAKFLTPCLGLLIMSLILAVDRPRLNNNRLHTVCRVVFSLALAAGLLFFPAVMIDSHVQFSKMTEARYFSSSYTDNPFTFEKMYFCSADFMSTDEVVLRICRVSVSRDMLSIIAAFLVVVELVVAGVVGDIGTS
ncbi:hypothetical protein BGZ82_004387 [Podila clonocystis]|nr:hypothetical protein BGZ82_004387 [Podila clonocystis]